MKIGVQWERNFNIPVERESDEATINIQNISNSVFSTQYKYIKQKLKLCSSLNFM